MHAADTLVAGVASELLASAVSPAQPLLRYFLDGQQRSHVARVAPPYLACFSSARDSATQWRDYGDDGAGVCLGISVLRGESHALDDVGVFLMRVDYTLDACRNKVSQGVSELCTAYADFVRHNRALERSAEEIALNAIYRVAAYGAMGTKDAKWQAEQEWRQIAIVRRRAGRETLERRRPDGGRYLQLPVRAHHRRIVLDEVIIGPRLEPRAAARAEAFLRLKGYPAEDAPLPKISESARPRALFPAEAPGDEPGPIQR